MNKDQLSGRVDQVLGMVKEVTGKVVGNDRLEAEGSAEKAKGKVQTVFGDTRENVKDRAKKLINKI